MAEISMSSNNWASDPFAWMHQVSLRDRSQTDTQRGRQKETTVCLAAVKKRRLPPEPWGTLLPYDRGHVSLSDGSGSHMSTWRKKKWNNIVMIWNGGVNATMPKKNDKIEYNWINEIRSNYFLDGCWDIAESCRLPCTGNWLFIHNKVP